MNEFLYAMQEQIDACDAKTNDACDAIMIFGVHGWSFESFSLIK